MPDISSYVGFIEIFGISILIGIALTIIVYFIFRKSRVMKYIPGTLIIIGFVVKLFLAENLFVPQNINQLIFLMSIFIAGIISLFTGLIIGILVKEKK